MPSWNPTSYNEKSEGRSYNLGAIISILDETIREQPLIFDVAFM